MQDRIKNLIDVSRKSLERNIVKTKHGLFLRAGGHQFQSFWTRDFCFASEGLTQLGYGEVTANHLTFLIQNRNSENLIPRGLDMYNPKIRVVRHTLFKFLPAKSKQEYKGNFYFEWKGEHGTRSMDSNLLVIIYAIKYFEETRDQEFKAKNFPHFKALLDFYKPYFVGGLLSQDEYSDWQDSVARTGQTSYLNLLYLKAMKSIVKHNIFSIPAEEIQKFETQFIQTFFVNDVIIAKKKSVEVSLDSNLLAIDWEVFDGKFRHFIYNALKNHPVWISDLPGQCTSPEYATSEKSFPTRFVGLNNYHDKMIWSWLVGCSLRVSKKVKDEEQVQKTLNTLSKITERDKTIYEIYHVEKDFKPFYTWIYNSESPFSWGAGQLIESLFYLTRAWPRV